MNRYRKQMPVCNEIPLANCSPTVNPQLYCPGTATADINYTIFI